MYTFDNAFSISFMFRDSKVGFTTGEDGLAAIYPVTPANKPANTENKQFLATLDYDLLEVCSTSKHSVIFFIYGDNSHRKLTVFNRYLVYLFLANDCKV